MKRTVLLIVFGFLILGILALPSKGEVESRGNNEGDVREIVWKQLSDQDKGRIDGTWQSGTVSNVSLTEDILVEEVSKPFREKVVYAIDFPTDDKGVTNNMVVYMDKLSFELIGHGLVD
ncbi:hypothetical protein [Alkalihalobacillus sp. R86527]|uniref:hypothetical protein n=1 Tax=Alkalihalobacillus sp. R86527 TaxID=3093863 RepID=UPI003672E39E